MRRRLYVISDLHLGGRPHGSAAAPGFQLCRAHAELRDFVTWIVDDTRAARAAGEDVEPVLNGDVVDFLAVDDDADRPRQPPLTRLPGADA